MDTQNAHISSCQKPDARIAGFLQKRGMTVGILILLLSALFTSGFWAAGNDKRWVSSTRVRFKLSTNVAPSRQGNDAATTQNVGPKLWAMRGSMSSGQGSYRTRVTASDWNASRNVGQDAVTTESLIGDSIIRFTENGIILRTLDGETAVDRLRLLSADAVPFGLQNDHRSLFVTDFSNVGQETPISPRKYAEVLTALSGECQVLPEHGLDDSLSALILRLRVPLLGLGFEQRAALYRPMIERAAKRFGISSQLIYAIMRTESGFNPYAVSHAGALGLMQLVPVTAGIEANGYLNGNSVAPSESVLFNPEQNIQFGSAYLYLLGARHFSQISNDTVRELCVIAAYNAGPNAVLRVFDQNRDTAIFTINGLSPQQVYERLTNNLPAEENRRYVDKVLHVIRSYASVQ